MSRFPESKEAIEATLMVIRGLNKLIKIGNDHDWDDLPGFAGSTLDMFMDWVPDYLEKWTLE